MERRMHSDAHSNNARSPLASLRRFMRPRAVQERCELCSAVLTDEHAHLVELATRRLCCACDACAILFDSDGAARYRRVPRRVERLTDFQLTEVQWNGLGLPINLAFFLHSTPARRVVALYPSPAGATEALPPPEAWQDIVDANPVLCALEPDVEALLVHRLGQAADHYRVGIDLCYKLTGVIRSHWRGLSGGARVWGEIAGFFDELNARCRPRGGKANA
jgi:hypothetical protein